MQTNTAREVADAWKHGRMLKHKSAISTDGHTVWSYDHEIGHTTEDGKKVAVRCPYSVTTRQHCGAIAVVADEVIDCLEHKTWVKPPVRRPSPPKTARELRSELPNYRETCPTCGVARSFSTAESWDAHLASHVESSIFTEVRHLLGEE